LKYKKSGNRHLLTGNPGGTTRKLRKSQIVDGTDMKRMAKFMPYAK
jgi:large subunit ribosomal protein L35